MMDDDLDQKDRRESIQHYARKKREGTSIGAVIGTIGLLMLVIIALFIILYR